MDGGWVMVSDGGLWKLSCSLFFLENGVKSKKMFKLETDDFFEDESY